MHIVLSTKGAKLMKLCEAEGVTTFEQLLKHVGAESVCPAICMTKGCNHTADMEPDQDRGYCEACGGNTMMSALVLAELV